VAHQVGASAHAALMTDEALRLSADLQRSRERLVEAREEERRRLRRVLHDGLGPQLSSQALTIDAALALMRRDPDAAEEMLLELKVDAQDAVTDIRRLVYGLRLPALDDLGLLGTIRETAEQYGAKGLSVRVEAPESLPPLSAAVEVACYRIFQEALTNVARHAGARLYRHPGHRRSKRTVPGSPRRRHRNCRPTGELFSTRRGRPDIDARARERARR